MNRRPTPNLTGLREGLTSPPRPSAGSAAAPPGPPAPRRDAQHSDASHISLDPNDVVLEGEYIRYHPNPEVIAALADSFRERGQLQAIGIRRVGSTLKDSRPVLVYGLTRLLAAREAGIRVLARDWGFVSEAEAYTMQALENLGREDLDPIDAAVGVATVFRHGGKKTQRDVSREVGRKDSWVSEMRRAGEALLELAEAERETLKARSVDYRSMQKIVTLPLNERVAEFRRLAQDAPPPAGRLKQQARGVARQPLRGGELAGGKGYRVHAEVRDQELRSDPKGTVERVRRFFEEQLNQLEQRAQRFEES